MLLTSPPLAVVVGLGNLSERLYCRISRVCIGLFRRITDGDAAPPVPSRAWPNAGYYWGTDSSEEYVSIGSLESKPLNYLQ